MRHHIVYWKMARREADVDATELAALQEEERRGEIYIEYVDGRRRSLTWDHVAHHWRAATPAITRTPPLKSFMASAMRDAS